MFTPTSEYWRGFTPKINTINSKHDPKHSIYNKYIKTLYINILYIINTYNIVNYLCLLFTLVVNISNSKGCRRKHDLKFVFIHVYVFTSLLAY